MYDKRFELAALRGKSAEQVFLEHVEQIPFELTDFTEARVLHIDVDKRTRNCVESWLVPNVFPSGTATITPAKSPMSSEAARVIIDKAIELSASFKTEEPHEYSLLYGLPHLCYVPYVPEK